MTRWGPPGRFSRPAHWSIQPVGSTWPFQPAEIKAALMALDGEDIDAFVQVGTNLPMARLAAAAETFLAKPVVSINTATYWHGLRTLGIYDRMSGFGALLADH